MKIKRDIIVIGTSAGGVEALSYLVSHLPSDLNAVIMIVLHLPSHATSVLPHILNRAGKIPALHPHNNQAILPRHIYIAPPDYHLLVKSGYVTLIRGPTENNHRPAIDPLFRTAARAYGNQVIGVVLTGVLDDGTAGLQAVKMRGGVAIVQDPEDATYQGMPRSAIELEQDNLLRFRCRIGHAYSFENLLAKQSDALEDALWFALRALEEKASLTKRMGKRMRDRNQILAAERMEQQTQDALTRASVIRETLIKGSTNTEDNLTS